MDQVDFRQFGGVPVVQAGADPNDPNATAWNFGVVNPGVVMQEASALPNLYDAFPNLQGRWDGKTSINHHECVRKVLGSDLPPHQQPSGTCGGRAGSRGLEILQAILIAAGKRAKFYYVSHAWPYFLARREYNMLRGGDGVADGSIPPVLAKYGALHREESGDGEMAGASSDRLAVSWGGGGLTGNTLAKFLDLARDNIITAMTRVRSAAELADGLASGGVGIISDSRGYRTTRDNDGFCAPSGVWYHYHVRSGIEVTSRGRKGFAYDQSWGRNVPSGPLLPGRPDNCFGVDWDVDDQNCRSGSCHVAFAFDLWDLESGRIPWFFG